MEILTRGYGGQYDAANALVQATKERTINRIGRRIRVKSFIVR